MGKQNFEDVENAPRTGFTKVHLEQTSNPIKDLDKVLGKEDYCWKRNIHIDFGSAC